MKPQTPPLLAVILGAALFGGCNTYHYYDIDIKAMSPVTEIQTSAMTYCQVVVSGAASDIIALADDVGCPPSKFPDLGTLEWATFVDSGQITFTFNGYLMNNVDPSDLCTSAATTLTASSQITQTGTITMTSFNEATCPPNVTP